MSDRGNDKEEYMTVAARENDHKLKGHFGKASWKVALEPERRTLVCRAEIAAYAAVSVHALSPLEDKILMNH